MSSDLQPEQLVELTHVLQTKGKLSAVKRYRELTRASLLESKNAVEELQRSGDLNTSGLENQNAMDRVLDAIAQGKKLEAVKLYKSHKRCSLKESKKFIEQLMTELGAQPQPRGGCLSVILLVWILASVARGWC